MIKVAMITRSTLFTVHGGDTVQALQTARILGAQGITADIKLTGERISYDDYDLLHFFNITRPADILYHIRKTKKPFVVSTIMVDYSEYDRQHRPGFSGMLLRHFTGDTIEYIKAIGRWLRGNDTLKSVSYIWKGQKRSIREIMEKATLLFPNSLAEYGRLQLQYDCDTRYTIVSNGVDDVLFRFDEQVEKDPNMVLCVARIEGIKNQLNLIRALNGSRYSLVIIGEPSPNQKAYYSECRRIALGNIYFIRQIPQERLVSYYQRAKVHVLPSWFETTGLSSLESAIMGCNIVITDKGYTREYFGNQAVYCDPSSADSIYAAVEKAALLPNDETLRLKIKTSFTWHHAGLQTAEGYKRIINDSWN